MSTAQPALATTSSEPPSERDVEGRGVEEHASVRVTRESDVAAEVLGADELLERLDPIAEVLEDLDLLLATREAIHAQREERLPEDDVATIV